MYRIVLSTTLLFLAFTAFIAPTSTFAQEISVVGFQAYALDSDDLVFQGDSRTSSEGGKVREVVIYRNPAGKEIQRAETVYEEAGFVLVSYSKVDHRSGESETMIKTGSVVELRYRESAEDDEESETLDWSESMGFTSMIVPSIRKNWALLAQGEEVEMDYLVPNRLGTVGFRLTKEGEETIGGKAVVVIRMEPSAFIIRLLVDPLYFYLESAQPRRLIQYRGRTSVKTDDGDSLDARLSYIHPD